MRGKHHHRYIRKLLGKDYIVYACNLPGCKHYIAANLVEGKLALCPKCDKTFIVTKDMVYKGREKKVLHCKDCNRPTWNKRHVKKEIDIDNFLKNLGVVPEIEQS